MDKKIVGNIEYVKPQALDLGALAIVHGVCQSDGLSAGIEPQCLRGFAPGPDCSANGGTPATCANGDIATT